MIPHEHPIIFSAPMVAAILAGRKTMTRRLVKPPVEGDFADLDDDGSYWWSGLAAHERRCPYGKPGDHLWVRETFRYYFDAPDLWDCIQYRQDMSKRKPDVDHMDNETGFAFEQRCECLESGEGAETRWRSPIHMPRWASRITLEITEIRVQRLHDISESDAKAEGVEELPGGFYRAYHPMPGQVACLLARISFGQLWASIHGTDSWHANPWVWVLTFRRLPDPS